MSAGKESKGPAIYKHWSRPHTRMYDYNYQVAESYYKPQVQYAGYLGGSKGRRARRRSASPPRAQSFLERWAAQPFYGKELDTIDLERQELVRSRNRAHSVARMERASSIPYNWVEDEVERQRNIRASTSRERSIYSYDRDYDGGYDDYVNLRRSRARSVSTTRPLDDLDLQWEFERDREFDELVRMADREEREKSIFAIRMSLDPDPMKHLMTTTLRHGLYQNSLYGTETWDPTGYLSGRQ